MFNRYKVFIYITFLATVLVSGCEIKQVDDSKGMVTEVERHKIKRLTQEDVLKAAVKAGDSIVTVGKQQLDQKLQEALQKGDIATAMTYCQPENYETVEELAYTFGGTASRTGTRLRNPQNKPTAAAAGILSQYAKGTLQGSQVVALDGQELLYTSPIYIRNENCLACHGTPGTEVATATVMLLQDRYPDDRATGYQLNELRGMWQVVFDRSELVGYLNDQPKKSRRRRP